MRKFVPDRISGNSLTLFVVNYREEYLCEKPWL